MRRKHCIGYMAPHSGEPILKLVRGQDASRTGDACLNPATLVRTFRGREMISYGQVVPDYRSLEDAARAWAEAHGYTYHGCV